jgi:hypothetical protein
MQVWLQRVTLPLDKSIDYEESICEVVAGSSKTLWNSEWISSKSLKEAMVATKIVDASARNAIDPVIPLKEVELFLSKVTGGYYK